MPMFASLEHSKATKISQTQKHRLKAIEEKQQKIKLAAGINEYKMDLWSNFKKINK